MMSKPSFYLGVLCFLLWLPVVGQDTEGFQRGIYVNDGDSLKYQILYPEGFSTAKKYPVILFLHGAGERGDDNELQLVHGSNLFLDRAFREQYPAVVIFPQCPKNEYWANADVKREPGKITLDFKDDGDPTPPMRLVLLLMDSVKTLAYSKDDQLYVGGLSMGGMGTFEILWRRPGMFAAAVPICGGGSATSVGTYADEVSLWVFHGARDNVVLPSYSTEMVIALMKAGADVKYTLYKEANHNSWDSAFAEPGLVDWLFSKSKND